MLGSFLRRLHRVPVAALDGAVPVEREPLASWLSQARREYVEVRDAVPPARRAPIEIFLSSPPPPDPTITALCHNDLGTEHLLVDPATGTITGIIDWGDAAITDPAYDLALILRDLGADVLRTVLDAYDDSYDAGEDAQPLR